MLEEVKVKTKLAVFTADEAYSEAALELSERLGVPNVSEESKLSDYELILCYAEDGLSLISGGQALRADFTHMLKRLKKNNLQTELLVKAAKIKGAERTLTVFDATAGFGEDSFLLAAAGFEVTLYEYNPVIFELLSDAVKRAQGVQELSEAVGRMSIHCGNSIDILKTTVVSPDIVLLHPMFPERQKSALVKKKFQLLHKLECPCEEEIALFNAALSVNPKKIIVKRPPKGAYLAGKTPMYSILGKAVRYDCYCFLIIISK